MANYTLPLGQLSLINHKSGSHQPHPNLANFRDCFEGDDNLYTSNYARLVPHGQPSPPSPLLRARVLLRHGPAHRCLSLVQQRI